MTYNIAIIGLGNIGRRHLEGLLRIKYKIFVHLFEINLESVKKTKSIIKQNENKNIKISLNKNIVVIGKKIDLLILATSSKQRYDIISNFIKLNVTINILIEKLAFNNLLEYKKTIKLMNEKNVNGFVNLQRRMFSVYKNIKEKLNAEQPIQFKVSMYNWNMASNTIHFLDLFNFFSNNRKLYLSKNLLERKIFKSKRKGYSEIRGTLEFKSKSLDHIVISDNNSYKNLELFIIEQDSIQFSIYEDQNKMITTNLKSKSKKINNKILLPYHSELTNLIADKIIKNKKINLPTLEDSYDNHALLLNTLKKHTINVGKNNLKISFT